MKKYDLKVNIEESLMKVFISKCLSCGLSPENVIASFIEDMAGGMDLGVAKEYFLNKWYPGTNDKFITFGQYLYKEDLEEVYSLAEEWEYISRISMLFGKEEEKEEAQKKHDRCEKTMLDLYEKYVKAMKDIGVTPQDYEKAQESIALFEEDVAVYNAFCISEEEEEEE